MVGSSKREGNRMSSSLATGMPKARLVEKPVRDGKDVSTKPNIANIFFLVPYELIKSS